MEKTYVYMHHQGFDFYLSNREKSDAELYCRLCDESDFLLGLMKLKKRWRQSWTRFFGRATTCCPAKTTIR